MLLKRLWRDQRGFVATTDMILIVTIVVLGTIVGLATLRNSVVQEFGDLATAVGRLDQTYFYFGNLKGTVPFQANQFGARVWGSGYTDWPDFGDVPDPVNQPPAGISVTEAPIKEGTGL